MLPRRPTNKCFGDGVEKTNMEEQIAFYFGSVAEGLIVLAIGIISGAALTNGYTVLKNHHQRSYRLSGRSPAWDSLAPWLVIAVAIALAVHLIKAAFTPSWITLMAAGAIAIIQLFLNWFINRDIQTPYLRLRAD
jgi:uncharacterized membrane protein